MNIGDVVKLKSGGAQMTVARKINEEEWECVWWVVKDEEFKARIFNSKTLQPYSQR